MNHEIAEASPPMPIGALAPWFGGKRNMAPDIVKQLGPHRVYWEPFCGSCAVLFAKPKCVMETINDLHGDLINLARVVQHETLSVALFERMSRTLMHEDLHQEAADRIRERGKIPAGDEPDGNRAYDYLLGSWLGRNGVAGTSNYNNGFCVRYTANGGHAAKRFMSVIESIPAWWHRLQNVTVLNRDAFELIDRIDDQRGTVIYIDSPYLVKGAKYAHDFDQWDHNRLSMGLRRFTKTRVVVSYYEHPRLAELYPPDRWTKVTHVVSKSLVSAGARAKGTNDVKAVEVLLINGPDAARLPEVRG